MAISADRSPLLEEGGRSTRIRLSSSPAPQSETASERLTEYLLVEILSRAPARSLSRFKCVSKHWLSLIDHPDHRRKLPQILAGFFYNTRPRLLSGSALHFTGVSGSRSTLIDTSFAFLPNHHRRIDFLDCCNGLLLLRLYDSYHRDDDFHYVVCNPLMEEWAELPDSGHKGAVIAGRLGFDPAVSPHFHVFILVSEQYPSCIDRLYIYSSETGRWVDKKKGWERVIGLCEHRSTVYLNGCLHFHAYVHILSAYSFTHRLAVVDTKGETWTTIDVPSGLSGSNFIQNSQGRLHYAACQRDGNANTVRLLLYVLKNYDSKEWILSHSVETSSIFGGIHVARHTDIDWIAVHPECNLIFFAVGQDTTFVCHDMDRRQVKVICDLEDGMQPYLSFVPLYTELQALHK